MKRARSAATQRVVIDVGGTKLTTTTATIQRSSYLAGMVDLDAWASDVDHCEEIFLDRDPEIFACVLRLMRQQPHIAGLLPHEPQLCASVIAEADFFGFEALLSHVKVQAYYNSREPADDYPKIALAKRAGPNETFRQQSERYSAARKAKTERCAEINAFFEEKNEKHALLRFDSIYGDIGDALRSGVLPAYFLARKPPPMSELSKKILQVLPLHLSPQPQPQP